MTRLRGLLSFTAPASALLVGCGSNSGARSEEPDPSAGSPPLGSSVARDVAGTYEVTLDDGTVIRQTISENGSYITADAQGVETEQGSWRREGSSMCFDPEGSEGESCYATGAGPSDGRVNEQDRGANVTSSVRKLEPSEMHDDGRTSST